MNDELFKAILAMDAYSRGYDKAIRITGSGTQLGTAQFVGQSSIAANSPEIDAGFYAIAYSYNGQTIISYRGTSTSSGGATLTDVVHGWPMGGGFIDSQAGLALRFYHDVADAQYPGVDWRFANIALTGHSLGGGLAGYVASLYGKSGVIYDNMTFNAAANATYSAASNRSNAGFAEHSGWIGGNDNGPVHKRMAA